MVALVYAASRMWAPPETHEGLEFPHQFVVLRLPLLPPVHDRVALEPVVQQQSARIGRNLSDRRVGVATARRQTRTFAALVALHHHQVALGALDDDVLPVSKARRKHNIRYPQGHGCDTHATR